MPPFCMRRIAHFLTAGRTYGLLVMAFTLTMVSTFAETKAPAIHVDGRTSILVDLSEPEPVRRAAEDLASDLSKVFAQTPRIVSDAKDAGPITIAIGQAGSGAPADHETAPESFSITSGTAIWGGDHPVSVIRLAGSDMRGTMYACYEFSKRFLGVDPMYYWTDHQPERRATVDVPLSLDLKVAPPVFRYRGFFINDEDLLTGWAPGETKDHTGISLEVWNRIFETILRLKGNMVVAGSWPFAGEPQERLAAERGLLLNQHHATPLGVNFSRWPANLPYNLTEHPEYIENAWKRAVAAYPADQQVLWEVGLRGLSDQPYADLDQHVRGDPKAEGRIISKAIAEQVKIVRAVHPDAVFVTDLWMEGAQLMRSGDLVLPPGVITVWPDTGYGDMQDHGQVRAGEGAYIHVAMENSYANQLSELTPVDRLFNSLSRFQTAGATSFLLVNTSDIRPVTMGTSASLEFGWQGSGAGSADEFYRAWSSKEFGKRAALAVAAVYKAYFAAPAVPTPTRPYGDNYYHTFARQLLRDAMVQWPTYTILGQSPFWVKPAPHPVPFSPDRLAKQVTKEIAACGGAAPRWDAVWKQALAAKKLVAPERRNFYQGAVLTMIEINRESNRMLLEIAESVQSLQKGDHVTAVKRSQQALLALDRIKIAEAKAEYGKWKGWYHGDWLTGVDRTRQLAENFAAYLKNPRTEIPSPIEMSNWEAYYYIQHYQGERQLDVR